MNLEQSAAGAIKRKDFYFGRQNEMWLDELGRAKKQVQDKLNSQPGGGAFTDNLAPIKMQSSSSLRVSTSLDMARRQ